MNDTPITVTEKKIFKTQSIQLEFVAQVNGASFSCEQTYSIGKDADQVRFSDLRMYLSKVRLRRVRDQEWIPLELVQNAWQNRGVALLDFENAQGRCAGTSETHLQIEGEISTDDYDSISFQMGIPFGLNHQEITVAASPFDAKDLYRNRREGYYFLNADLSVLGSPGIFRLRLGSQDCHGQGIEDSHTQTFKAQHITDENPDELPSYCEAPQRPVVTLPIKDLTKQKIVLDMGEWLQDVSIKNSARQNSTGCASGQDDPEFCTDVYRDLGLFFGNKPAREQKLWFITEP